MASDCRFSSPLFSPVAKSISPLNSEALITYLVFPVCQVFCEVMGEPNDSEILTATGRQTGEITKEEYDQGRYRYLELDFVKLIGGNIV